MFTTPIIKPNLNLEHMKMVFSILTINLIPYNTTDRDL